MRLRTLWLSRNYMRARDTERERESGGAVPNLDPEPRGETGAFYKASLLATYGAQRHNMTLRLDIAASGVAYLAPFE